MLTKIELFHEYQLRRPSDLKDRLPRSALQSQYSGESGLPIENRPSMSDFLGGRQFVKGQLFLRFCTKRLDLTQVGNFFLKFLYVKTRFLQKRTCDRFFKK